MPNFIDKTVEISIAFIQALKGSVRMWWGNAVEVKLKNRRILIAYDEDNDNFHIQTKRLIKKAWTEDEVKEFRESLIQFVCDKIFTARMNLSREALQELVRLATIMLDRFPEKKQEEQKP